jgi:predicted HicB family RNase H-like nuclease
MAETKKRAYTQAQNKATQKYIKNNYDEFKIRLDKGNKAVLKKYAEMAGESLNAYVKKAVANRIEKETGDKIEL